MSSTVIGYNRDPCEPGAPTKIDSIGVNLVTKDDDIICIPAGNGVVQIQLKLVNPAVPLAGTATNLQVVVDDGVTQTVVLTVAKTQLNAVPSVSLVGTDASPIANASNSEIGIKLRADSGDFGPVGPVISALLKYKPMPTL